jgi:hypothetical protein
LVERPAKVFPESGDIQDLGWSDIDQDKTCNEAVLAHPSTYKHLVSLGQTADSG